MAVTFLACFLSITVVNAEDTTRLFEVPAEIASLLKSSCNDCHGKDLAEGSVDLSSLQTATASERLEVLNKAQEQLHFGLMPPQEAGELGPQQRAKLLTWMGSELSTAGVSRLQDKLRKPEYGNYISHEDLFTGRNKHLKAFTYDRRWLISEYIFEARFNEILNHRPYKTIDGRRQHVIGENNRRVNLTNPFLLPPGSGVRYYSNEVLNGGHLLTMLTNAKEVAEHIMYLAGRDRRYVPAIYEIMDLQWNHVRTLSDREKFLNQFIEPILVSIYQEDHGSMLPTFERVKIRSANSTDIKKSPFHAAQPGASELVILYHAMEKHSPNAASDAEWIEKCEQDWFNHGYSERTIQTRLTFLAGYLEEFRAQVERHRYAKKHKTPVYRPRPEPEQKEIEDTILATRKPGDRYLEIIHKCLETWRMEFEAERLAAGPPGQETIDELVHQLYQLLYRRAPSADELTRYGDLTQNYLHQLGNLAGIKKLIQTLILKTDFVYRNEYGTGKKDADGRRMLSPRDASYAIAYALTDSSPDSELAAAAAEGRLLSKADYKREVERMLSKRDQFYVIDEAVQRLQLTASITNTPIRKLRFFREFFGYPQLLSIFKDNKRFGGNYDNAKGRLVGEADRLVDHILQRDKDVFHELLTTNSFYVYHSGDNDAMTAASRRIRRDAAVIASLSPE